MSRTYRRKNAWNKWYYVVDSQDRLDFWRCYSGTITGQTDEQIAAKVKAKFHGETPDNWGATSRSKKSNPGLLRARNKVELYNLLHHDEEQFFTTLRDIKSEWWYYQE